MIGRKTPTTPEDEDGVGLRGFDDFELRLGDIMRGERATLGKSLLDVQRELRIKAAYIAAIENTDPSAFDTPGFIAGYVRSYARYLNMDPEAAFQAFCEESGFSVAHGMSSKASVVKKAGAEDRAGKAAIGRDPFSGPGTLFEPTRESIFNQIDPRAIASSLVLITLIGGIGFGGWSVLKQVQQVQVAPVDRTPVVLSDLDPLRPSQPAETDDASAVAPTAEALDRLYRPQALDVPVLVARDAPISTLDPRKVGTFSRPALPQVQRTELAYGTPSLLPEPLTAVPPQVVEDAVPSLSVVAVRPAWVRVSASDGTVLYEGIMEGGARFDVPATEEPPVLRAGESGSVYLAVNDTHFGPVGARGTVTSGTVLSIDAVKQSFAVANLEADGDLSQLVAERVAEIEAPVLVSE